MLSTAVSTVALAQAPVCSAPVKVLAQPRDGLTLLEDSTARRSRHRAYADGRFQIDYLTRRSSRAKSICEASRRHTLLERRPVASSRSVRPSRGCASTLTGAEQTGACAKATVETAVESIKAALKLAASRIGFMFFSPPGIFRRKRRPSGYAILTIARTTCHPSPKCGVIRATLEAPVQ